MQRKERIARQDAVTHGCNDNDSLAFVSLQTTRKQQRALGGATQIQKRILFYQNLKLFDCYTDTKHLVVFSGPAYS